VREPPNSPPFTKNSFYIHTSHRELSLHQIYCMYYINTIVVLISSVIVALADIITIIVFVIMVVIITKSRYQGRCLSRYEVIMGSADTIAVAVIVILITSVIVVPTVIVTVILFTSLTKSSSRPTSSAAELHIVTAQTDVINSLLCNPELAVMIMVTVIHTILIIVVIIALAVLHRHAHHSRHHHSLPHTNYI
jgi:hypothetical protein